MTASDSHSKKPTHFDYSAYDSIVFVDASGDDGVDFKKPGTSPLYIVGCFSCSPDQIKHNNDVVENVKRLLGCRIEDEMKSSVLIKHRLRMDAIRLLSTLSGKLSMHIVFKKVMDPTIIVHNSHAISEKHFTAFYHTLSMNLAIRNVVGNNLLFIVDNMKKKEIENAKVFGEQLAKFDPTTVKIIYRDSRAPDFQLLQAIDWLVGLYRKAIEVHFNEKGNLGATMCMNCNAQRNICRRNPRKMLTSRFIEMSQLKTLYCLDVSRKKSFWDSISVTPPQNRRIFHFMDCI